ncbi:hypothetical protein LAV79_24015 [Peribacillus butanolivorans]|uniref:hypothetical protein n=1 Tax=Peribacillus butanolivorans TaxID=421767 RepID=UPI0030C90D15
MSLIYYEKKLIPQFWKPPANMLGGLTGIFSAIGNLGGFFGPFIVGAIMSGGNKIAGLLFLSGIYIISAILK